MKIIISPAKKMNVDTDTLAYTDLPCFIEDTDKLTECIKKLDFAEAKKLWQCNDKIALLNFNRFKNINIRAGLTPALLSYEGIQYQYMAPGVFTDDELRYVQDCLRILSGFYGILKPFDGVTPYRLEMQAKVSTGDFRNLYEFWGDKLYKKLTDDSRTIVNLASKEYSRCVENHLKANDRFVTCVFGEFRDGKIIQKGTQVKMARGEMVRFMAQNKIKDPEELKQFDRLNYVYEKNFSCNDKYVFIKHK